MQSGLHLLFESPPVDDRACHVVPHSVSKPQERIARSDADAVGRHCRARSRTAAGGVTRSEWRAAAVARETDHDATPGAAARAQLPRDGSAAPREVVCRRRGCADRPAKEPRAAASTAHPCAGRAKADV